MIQTARFSIGTIGTIGSLALAALLLSACGMMGDTDAIRKANELAIDCRTDEALRALDQAEQGGGVGEYLAGLERVGILRDAGRDAEAAAALATYKSKPEVKASDAELEDSVEEFIAELRKERREQRGSATCPG